MLVVGPESAGAHPGPVCYRKGGYLAVTDANAVLGRILPQEFPAIFGPHEDEPLHVQEEVVTHWKRSVSNTAPPAPWKNSHTGICKLPTRPCVGPFGI
jgi:N-methylhydantoinase A/oxoprolinase/acetone carboxylase beta subunit